MPLGTWQVYVRAALLHEQRRELFELHAMQRAHPPQSREVLEAWQAETQAYEERIARLAYTDDELHKQKKEQQDRNWSLFLGG